MVSDQNQKSAELKGSNFETPPRTWTRHTFRKLWCTSGLIGHGIMFCSHQSQVHFLMGIWDSALPTGKDLKAKVPPFLVSEAQNLKRASFFPVLPSAAGLQGLGEALGGSCRKTDTEQTTRAGWVKAAQWTREPVLSSESGQERVSVWGSSETGLLSGTWRRGLAGSRGVSRHGKTSGRRGCRVSGEWRVISYLYTWDTALLWWSIARNFSKDLCNKMDEQFSSVGETDAQSTLCLLQDGWSHRGHRPRPRSPSHVHSLPCKWRIVIRLRSFPLPCKTAFVFNAQVRCMPACALLALFSLQTQNPSYPSLSAGLS